MPTFKIFRSGSVIETIQGADVRGLTAAVEKAVKLAGTAAAPVYSSAGRTLGGAPRTSTHKPFNFKGIIDTIITFLGLYFISLFSLDGYAAAEKSPFNIHRVVQPVTSTTGRPGEKRIGVLAQTGKKVGTIADLGGD